MATVDSLDIQISASMQKASATIDSLNGKLDELATSLSGINSGSLAGLANGINRLSSAMQSMKSVGTADFTRLAKNIEKLGDINVSGLNSAASSMSLAAKAFNNLGTVSENATKIGQLAASISKLGSKGAQAAIDNIPKLANAMDGLMATLSKSPKISQNIIDMTNALANLAQQSKNVSFSSKVFSESVNKSSVSMEKATKSGMGLAVAIGKVYAAWFFLARGARKLWKSIENSFGYIEVLNYFDAAFGQVASNADLSGFEQMGYDSAEAYYGSFAKRAEELTARMSGFTVGENGMLQATGGASLGLDPSQLMNYQAMFGQMSSSMGVSSETALKLSQALTELGADLASVKNLDFADVWEDMASGLAGMSRTLDKYGVNIRNVNLQQKLTELGIEANISALNQNDKALLRAIILLDSTRYAWADLAGTINQPANQLRMIQANFQNLSRTIGSLFLPLIQKVLPYVNALVIALQRLFSWFGNLLGIDLSGISTAVGGTDFGDILDQTDDLTSGLGDAKKAADKLNKSLQKFDELNVITTKQDDESGSGIGGGIGGSLLDAAFEDAFSEYQKVWDEAFANLENKAQELADKIEKAFEPIKKIIQDFAIGEFFQAGKDTSALVVSLFDFFADAIDKVNWYGIGKKIGDFLAGIDWIAVFSSLGNLIWQAIKASIELWKGSFDAAPIETGIITAIALLKWTGLGYVIFKSIKKAIVSKLGEIAKIFTNGGFLTNIGLVIENLFSGLTLNESMLAVFGKVGTAIAGIGTIISGVVLAVTNFFSMWNNGWSLLKEILKDVGIALAAVGAVILGVAAAPAAIVAAIVAAVSTIAIVIHDNWDAICEWFSGVAEWIEENVIQPVIGFFQGVWTSVSGFFSNLWNDIVSIWGAVSGWFSENVIEPVVSFFVGLATRVQQVFEGLWIIIQAVWKVVSEWFNENVIQPVGELFSSLWEGIKSVWSTVSSWFNENVIIPVANFFKGLWESISSFFSNLWEDIKTIWSVVSGWFDEHIIKPVSNAFKAACEAIGGFFSSLWSGIKKGVAGAMNAVIGGIEGAINWIVDGINGIINGFNKVVDWAAGVIGVNWGGVDLVPQVSLGRIDVSGYATGGFPDKYSLFMAGEYGTPELIGTVGGKTAVAGQVTTPYLITNFIGNINNFGVIYFLTGGGPSSLDYYKGAGKTDLLVTWLYKLTNDSNDYNLAATLGILIFIISAVFSMFTYAQARISENEEALQ